MITVLRGSWAILFGIFLLMIGNGLQGGLLAYRGEEEGFSALFMSMIMSAYFAGLMIGSYTTTPMIKRVGHVRVFAAYASLISAGFIFFPLVPNEWVWVIVRVIIGICFAGVYIVAESWLNHSTENALRGQVLSAYVFIQMAGVVFAAWLLRTASVSGYELFVLMSILVSLSFAPILLSNEKAPVFETSEAMSIRELYDASPLGFFAVVAVGGVFALQFSMVGVYTAAKGFGVDTLSLMLTFIYVGGMISQYPTGWLSDRIDRRLVIIAICGIAAVVLLAGVLFNNSLFAMYFMAFVMGAVSNPLYSIAVAYINDRVAWEKMASAAAGVTFAAGVGSVVTPLIVGYAMQVFGAEMFWVMGAFLFAMIALYGIYRSTQRAAVEEEETAVFTAVTPAASAVMMEVTQEYVAEQVEEQLEEAAEEAEGDPQPKE